MTQSIGGFFSGGAKGITWPAEPPASVSGTILQVFEPEEIIDPAPPNKPTGKFQVRIMLQTDLRDPNIDEDDGRRMLYVKSWMRGAVAEAMRKAGVKEPRIGDTLTVTFVRTEPPSSPGLSASKHFSATYVKSGTAGEFFNGDEAQTGRPPTGPQRPDSIDAAAWAAMDASTKEAVANTMANMPPF